MSEVHFKKRHLHAGEGKIRAWLDRTPEERIDAVEFIRMTSAGSEYAEQEFPRVYRITRKVRS